MVTATRLGARDGEVRADLHDHVLAGSGDDVGLVDTVTVGLDSLHRGARVLGESRVPDLGGVVAGEQLLVGALALRLVDARAGARRRGRSGGARYVGGRDGRADPHSCGDERACGNTLLQSAGAEAVGHLESPSSGPSWAGYLQRRRRL